MILGRTRRNSWNSITEESQSQSHRKLVHELKVKLKNELLNQIISLLYSILSYEGNQIQKRDVRNKKLV